MKHRHRYFPFIPVLLSWLTATRSTAAADRALTDESAAVGCHPVHPYWRVLSRSNASPSSSRTSLGQPRLVSMQASGADAYWLLAMLAASTIVPTPHSRTSNQLTPAMSLTLMRSSLLNERCPSPGPYLRRDAQRQYKIEG